ncbi:MAG: hypothetical protein N2111_14645, partial [Candidatus Sumerlaeaceae bacterium]|nr:hypothetical protein [Candidatus Sumerlaeaceae bacterium]
MKFSFVARFAAALAVVSMTVIAGAGGADMPASKTAPAVPVAVAEDLSVVLVTGDQQQGLAVVNTDSKKTIEITATPHTGYYATIAPSGNFVCYKDFVDDGRGGKLQVPSL